MGKSVLLYTLTMQLSRGQFANLFKPHFLKDGTRAGFKGINNPIANISNTLAERDQSFDFSENLCRRGNGVTYNNG